MLICSRVQKLGERGIETEMYDVYHPAAYDEGVTVEEDVKVF
jgi:hypothetical protein